MMEYKAGTANRTTTPRGIDLDQRRVHFVGIGGCGMSGLARIARQRGAVCTGSDLAASETTRRLIAEGIAVTHEQHAGSVPDGCDLLVISAAIRPDHPELVAARRRGVEVLKYAELLGRLMSASRGVAVAGTHGKSTTTSLLSHVLITAGLDPSFIVGANCPQIGGGARVGGGDLLVAEACEYDRSFHNFHPAHAVILNLEADHLDLYRSLDEIVEAFAVFARQVRPEGSLLIQHEMPQRLAVVAGLGCAVETIGYAPQADWRVRVEGRSVELHGPDADDRCAWRNPLAGEHMAYNAAAAAVLAHRVGVPWDRVGPAIESFQGLDRRMQTLGRHAGVTVVDDYGHHPTEIDTTLRALRQAHQPARLICVFQPHQHSRTRFFLDEFAASFGEADLVLVPDIYFVRDSENERQAVTADDLVQRLRRRGVEAIHLAAFEAIVEHLQTVTHPGDLVVTMGAGDVWKIGRSYLSLTRDG